MIFRRSLVALSLCALTSTTSDAASIVPAPRGYFVSIDGLNPTLLDALQGAGKLDARRGLGWLRANSLYSPKTSPVVTTLTAASHIGTITCTPPSRHGITANSFLKAGTRVSGYTDDFVGEPLWKAASRQGLTTLALAYVGADGRTPERTADFGLAYPSDTITGPSQTLVWDPSTLAAAQGWTLTPELASRTDLKEAEITLTLNPVTGETKTSHALIDLASAPAAVYFDADKDLVNGSFGRTSVGESQVVDLFFIETDPTSSVAGVKRRAFARLLPRTDTLLEVYVSKPSYNNAYPASFRQALDDANMVWPDYGVRSSRLTVLENLEAQAMIDRFLTDVAVRFAPIIGAEVVLLYQPLIDSIGHKYQSSLPLPFNPDGTDDITKAFVRAFEVIDDNMSRLFATVRSRDVIALMGDHGMDPTFKVVNLAALLPAESINRIEVVTSGALAMIYAPVSDASPSAETAAAAIGQDLRDALAGVSYNGLPALGEAIRRSDPPRGRRPFDDEWHYGEALWGITAGTGFYWTYNPLSRDVLIDASALGMHGQALSTATMATALMIKGPGVRPQRLTEASLIDAVPTFSALMGVQPPADCLGQSLVRRR